MQGLPSVALLAKEGLNWAFVLAVISPDACMKKIAASLTTTFPFINTLLATPKNLEASAECLLSKRPYLRACHGKENLNSVTVITN
jgi:hypothetical protein